MKNNRILFYILIALVCSAAGAQEYGLVLSGGGGKGAYEVGVWKALNEYGIAQRTTVISGTSVGGLNGALFACEKVPDIEALWINQVPQKLTQENGSEVLISQSGLDEIISTVPLFQLQEKKYPQVIVTTVRKRAKLVKRAINFLFFEHGEGNFAHRFVLNNEADVTEIEKELLATSAFPFVCPAVRLADGYEYTDGGEEGAGGDNLPVNPIVTSYPQVKYIVVVHLDQKQQLKKIDYDNKRLIEIWPSFDLGGMLKGTTNFSQDRISLLIEEGYKDAVKVLESEKYYPVSSYWFDTTVTIPANNNNSKNMIDGK